MSTGVGILGSITRVDRTLGTVDATLRSGVPLAQVPYSGLPPYVGKEARFQEVSPGSWICLGMQADNPGYGPNLCANPEFEVDLTGWDTSAGVKSWNFDGTTESWTTSNCTITV